MNETAGISPTGAPGALTPDLNAPAPSPAPMPAPVAPTPIQPTIPVSTTPTVKFDVMRDINWLETIIIGVGFGALCYTIAYYRYKLKEDKLMHSDTQRQLDSVSQRIAKVETDFSFLVMPRNG